ncbi:MAG: carboxypeptidase-like regulatory domain-containing protein [Acidobacteriia bacterium]|jgi:hypothetical protein|nr:carboxypeptidase-like regulatory domain-containing protein [Terriglobia bacterium]
MLRNLGLVILGIAVTCAAQERFQSGELKGFTKSPTEHIITRIDDPITVSSVRGLVVFSGKDEPLKDVLFEIRGPGNQERIRAAKTGSDGRFKIGRVPEGIYTFKATRDGFQSVVGTLIVSKRTDRRQTIKIEMPLGV